MANSEEEKRCVAQEKGKIAKKFDKFYNALDKVVKALLVIVVAVLILTVFLNVIGRYFLKRSIDWSEEMSLFTLIWIVFLGGISAYINSEHLTLNILDYVVSKKVSSILSAFACIVVIISSGLLAYGGYIFIASNLDWVSPVLGVPFGLVRSALPIASFIICILAIMKLIEHIEEVCTMKGSDNI